MKKFECVMYKQSNHDQVDTMVVEAASMEDAFIVADREYRQTSRECGGDPQEVYCGSVYLAAVQ